MTYLTIKEIIKTLGNNLPYSTVDLYDGQECSIKPTPVYIEYTVAGLVEEQRVSTGMVITVNYNAHYVQLISRGGFMTLCGESRRDIWLSEYNRAMFGTMASFATKLEVG